MKKSLQKNGLILAAFCFVACSLIALTYTLTYARIASEKQRQLLHSLHQLVPEQNYNNEMHTDCIVVAPDKLLGNTQQRIYRARKDQQAVALIIETLTPKGYSGDISMLVAIDVDNKILGARVTSHKETPGLGDKIDLRISDWILSFDDTEVSEQNASTWQVKKDGGNFDQFTGATITPRAVVEAVKNAAVYGKHNILSVFEQPSNCNTEDSAQLDEAAGVEQ